MADSSDSAHYILHVKDSYYFEVPKSLWRYHTLSDVPEWLRNKEHLSLAGWKKELDGKILIPQPLGTLKSLYAPQSGFCISRFMLLELFAAVVVAFIFIRLADRMKDGDAPKGRVWNFFEAMLLFIRDQVARPAIGHHDAEKFTPFLWTLFFFILTCNLLGMFPWMGSATGALGMTLAMALIVFFAVVTSGMIKLGPIGFWKSLVPHMEMPLILAVFLIPMIFVIEVAGLLIKHFVLSVRLLANMFAGHLVLAVVLGFIAMTAESNMWYAVMPASVLGAVALSMLELFVAFLQAYIFAFLAALFIGTAIHPH